MTEAEAGGYLPEEAGQEPRKIRWLLIASSILVSITIALTIAGVLGCIKGMKVDIGLEKS